LTKVKYAIQPTNARVLVNDTLLSILQPIVLRIYLPSLEAGGSGHVNSGSVVIGCNEWNSIHQGGAKTGSRLVEVRPWTRHLVLDDESTVYTFLIL
jgi:hypothetical protein